jgi:hypothetical protein
MSSSPAANYDELLARASDIKVDVDSFKKILGLVYDSYYLGRDEAKLEAMEELDRVKRLISIGLKTKVTEAS